MGFATPSTLSSVSFHISTVATALAAAEEFLGSRDSRKIGHNTYLVRKDEGAAVRFHATEILVIRKGAITLTSGGYRTYTTKERISTLLPDGYRIYAERGIWYVSTPEGRVTFADGLTIKASGKVAGAGSEDRDLKLRKAIHAYANAYARAAASGELEAPGGGDCWHCSMIVSNGPEAGKPLGDATRDQDHLRDHMREGYFVPSLLVNAAKATGNRWLPTWGFWLLWGEDKDGVSRADMLARDRGALEREVRATVRKYLGARLGLALR